MLCPYQLLFKTLLDLFLNQALQAFLKLDHKTDNSSSHHIFLVLFVFFLLTGSSLSMILQKDSYTWSIFSMPFLKCELRASILVGLLRKSSGTRTFGSRWVAVAVLVCKLFTLYFYWWLCYVVLEGGRFHLELNGQMGIFQPLFDSVKLGLRHNQYKGSQTF